eukprot:365636-Chlamydomonas_euryale.AAC.9
MRVGMPYSSCSQRRLHYEAHTSQRGPGSRMAGSSAGNNTSVSTKVTSQSVWTRCVVGLYTYTVHSHKGSTQIHSSATVFPSRHGHAPVGNMYLETDATGVEDTQSN